MDDAEIPNQVFTKSPGRPNLVARLPGEGNAPPLLLQGHVDVVPADPAQWQQAPFDGELVDGYLWGRGSLDMKSGIAMMVTALIRTKTEGITPAGEIILALVCDEEAGGDQGVRFLVENHPEQFEGVRYAIGEFGAFSFNLGKRRFYPIMVAEKPVCHLRVTFRGVSGHASLLQQHNPMSELSRFLQRLHSRELPVHVTPEARLMFKAIADRMPLPARAGLTALLNPRTTAITLKLLGAKGRTFSPLFRNTVTPTLVRGGHQINVVPGEVSVDLDGRLLPGLDPELLIVELTDLAGPNKTNAADMAIEILHHDPGPERLDMGLFETGIIRDIEQRVERRRPGRNTGAHADARSNRWKNICPPWDPDLRIFTNVTTGHVGFRRDHSRSQRACPHNSHRVRSRGYLPSAAAVRTHPVPGVAHAGIRLTLHRGYARVIPLIFHVKGEEFIGGIRA